MKIGIIGFGNLGRSLCEGLLLSGSAAKSDIFVCEKVADGREYAKTTYGVNVTDSLNEVLKLSAVVFLTIKSYVFEEIAPGADRALLSGKTVVSFMAGVGFEDIYGALGSGFTLVRAMPSLAIASCDGVVGYTRAPSEIASIFDKLGYAFETEAENIEKVMAFSSCGLGFAAYLTDAFASAGEKMGFDRATSEMISARTFRNAIDRGDYKSTVKSVATKGGATEQGILHMEKNRVFDTVSEAVEQAYIRMTK
jgi:pyrroline-5-carboxylate reductase